MLDIDLTASLTKNPKCQFIREEERGNENLSFCLGTFLGVVFQEICFFVDSWSIFVFCNENRDGILNDGFKNF